MTRALFLFLLLIYGQLFAGQKYPETLDEQLFIDNKVVINYLKALTDSDIGKKLNGVKLSDENIVLKNHIFLERINSEKNKYTVYVFRHYGKLVSYAWVEEDGLPLPIPSCPTNYKEEGQYVLSGDVYTWKDVHPGDGVVILDCVTEKWINEIKNNR